jgi:hypothetical protein
MNSQTVNEGTSSPHAPPTGSQPAPAEGMSQAPTPPSPYPYMPYQQPVVPRQRERTAPAWSGWVIGGVIAIIAVVGLMVAIAAAVIGGFIAANVGLLERTATSSSSYTVTGSPNLVVSNPAGNVTVQSGTGNQVTVLVTKHARGNTAGAASDALSNTLVDVTQSGNTVTVSTRFNGVNLANMGRRSVDLIVTAPAASSLDLNLGAGNVTVRQMSGAATLVTGAGNVTLDDATLAGTSRISTGAGNVEVTGTISPAASVNVHVGAGNVTMSLLAETPARLEASTGVGNLTITGWPVAATGIGFTGHRASGDLAPNPTATLTVDVGTGNLTLLKR